MSLYALNPFIRFAKRFHALTKTSQPSICYDCRLFFISKASGSIIIEKNEYCISKNTAIFLPPGTHYQFFFKDWNNLEIIAINFDLTDSNSHKQKSLGTATSDNFDEANLSPLKHFDEINSEIIVENAERIEHNLIKCCKEFLVNDTFYRERASCFLKISLIDLINKSQNSQMNSPIIASAMQYIYDNFENPTLSNKSIAKDLNYHPNYLNKMIKESTGKTLHQNILTYRIHIAKNMLITSKQNIDDISWKTGFNSTSHFIAVFRKITGVTPYQYRKSHMMVHL